MVVGDEILAEVVRRVLLVAQPDRIILFGSAARGDITPDSDIDLLVVEPGADNLHERSVAIRRAIGSVGSPVDVVVMTRAVWERTREVVGGLAYPASKYGRVLYAA